MQPHPSDMSKQVQAISQAAGTALQEKEKQKLNAAGNTAVRIGRWQSCQLWLSAQQICLQAMTGIHADSGVQISDGRLQKGARPVPHL